MARARRRSPDRPRLRVESLGCNGDTGDVRIAGSVSAAAGDAADGEDDDPREYAEDDDDDEELDECEARLALRRRGFLRALRIS